MAPHKNLDLIDVAIRIRDKGFHPPLPEEMPEWLQNLCERCWNMEPSERPTMKEVVEVFRKFISDFKSGTASVGPDQGSSIQSLPKPSPAKLATKLTDTKSSASEFSSTSEMAESSEEEDDEEDEEEESVENESGESENS